MSRRWLRWVVLMSVSAVGLGAPAAVRAAPRPGGCPTAAQWTLATVEDMADETYHLISGEAFPTQTLFEEFVDATGDRNDDDQVCFTVRKPIPGHDDNRRVSWIENNKPVRAG